MKDKILKDRYLQPGETEDTMYRRVAKTISMGDGDLETQFYTIMRDGDFLPNTPTLVNAGSDRQGGLSACYVVPIEDSLKGIYKAVYDQGMIHQSFGGTGFDFSDIRPSGSLVNSTKGNATGPIGFMHLFNANAASVRQGGHREGGNMGILRIDHPDIEEFINCKSTEGILKHFNISIAITDEFMDCYINNKVFCLKWNNRIVKTVSAKSLFDKLVDAAWRNGEPGVVFIDEINRYNPTPKSGKMKSTNPCGEQPLLPYESCNLGSINLHHMVRDGHVDWLKLETTTRLAVRFLNNVIDTNTYPIPEVEKMTKETRKIGLGIMGWHSMLIRLGIPYASTEAYELAEGIMQMINATAVDESHAMTREDNEVFPTWNGSIWEQKGITLMNATLTTIAPTGSISIIAGCSSGIQPIFAWKHIRTIESGTFELIDPLYNEAVSKNLLACGLDIPWDAHIKTQAAFQKHTHNAVSITVNLPKTATREDVKACFVLAHQLGSKGITVYRHGSRRNEVLSTGMVLPEVRPRKVPSNTYKLITGCGSMFVSLGKIGDKLYETIIPSSSGGCHPNREAIGRLLTRALKKGDTIEGLNEELQKCKCTTAMKRKESECNSCPAGIGDLMVEEIGVEVDNRPKCPQCKQPLEFEGGCHNGICPGCGWGGCS